MPVLAMAQSSWHCSRVDLVHFYYCRLAQCSVELRDVAACVSIGSQRVGNALRVELRHFLHCGLAEYLEGRRCSVVWLGHGPEHVAMFSELASCTPPLPPGTVLRKDADVSVSTGSQRVGNALRVELQHCLHCGLAEHFEELRRAVASLSHGRGHVACSASRSRALRHCRLAQCS